VAIRARQLEVAMSTTDASPGAPTDAPASGAIDMKLEVVALPVSDVDRAKSFYQGLGWRLELVVSDIEAAREALTARGVEVSDFFHSDGNGWLLQEVTTRLPGREWED
jgi:hypothetical protein